MQRTCMKFLIEWLTSKRRKPLIIRGARQVGKTWVVRHLAELQDKNLVEINFEETPQSVSLFTSNDPQQILLNLESVLDIKIDPKKSILFLDEIQAAPELIAKLRWFAEKMPVLPVIAAGSLLEFALEKYPMSMPVGRIEYMYLEPLSFEEFLLAQEKHELVESLKRFGWKSDIPLLIHEKLMRLFKEYVIIGGMPEAVVSWIEEHSFQIIGKIHQNLITTYRDDFSKYSGRLDPKIIDDVLQYIPKSLGKKFVYRRVNMTAQIPAIKKSLNLLCKARLCHKVKRTDANGIPLGAEAKDDFLRIILLDVGLCSAILGITLHQLEKVDELELINKGSIAEQITGQLLRTIFPLYQDPSLYYWLRPKKGASAEIDYVIQQGGSIIPIEVKAGTTGSLKSLHVFMSLKKLPVALRINSALPRKTTIDTKDYQGTSLQYELTSLPFYLIGELQRLMNNHKN